MPAVQLPDGTIIPDFPDNPTPEDRANLKALVDKQLAAQAAQEAQLRARPNAAAVPAAASAGSPQRQPGAYEPTLRQIGKTGLGLAADGLRGAGTALTSLLEGAAAFNDLDRPTVSRNPRSEERRVGKECRSRWSPYH